MKTCLCKNVFVQVRKANLHQSKQKYQGTSGHVLECFQWQIFPPCLALSFPSFQCITDMRGSRNIFRGGGSMSDGQKTICSMFSLQRNLYFSKDPEGVQQYPGVQLFPGGIQMLVSIETHITFDFQGASRPHYPPLDPHMTGNASQRAK